MRRSSRRTAGLPSRFQDFDLGPGRQRPRVEPSAVGEVPPSPAVQPPPAAARRRPASPEPERGTTRSGARFSSRNLPYYRSLRELLSHHQRLLQPGPIVDTRYLGLRTGSLLQTTVRFRSDYPDLARGLREVFLDLFNQHTPERGSGFEVVTTFNAVLSNRNSTSFSLFYGHDYRTDNRTGAFSGLRYGEPVFVRSLLDLHRIPHQFDLESLASQQRHAFDSSDVRVVRIINVVYLVYQYAPSARPRLHQRRKPLSGQGPHGGPGSFRPRSSRLP